jgi:hypothetical protein
MAIMATRKISFKALEELIGHLEHVCLLLHPVGHFLGSLRAFSTHSHATNMALATWVLKPSET